MLNQSLFLFFSMLILFACNNPTPIENNKTEGLSVNNSTSQPILPSQKPVNNSSQINEGQTVPPNSPTAQTDGTDFTKPTSTKTVTSSRPSPEKTKVAPAGETGTYPTSPRTKSDPTPPATRSESVTTEPITPPIQKNQPEGKKEVPSVSPPVPSGNQNASPTQPQNPPTLSHQPFDGLLRKYVSSTGKVDYKGFKSEETQLDAYLNLLKNNPPQSSWQKEKAMAYWINAYNAFTIKLIVDNYPVSSITKLDGGKPWDKKWINIGGKSYSLNNIENDILRPKYKDARIHFAVNCAAKSCPPLLNRAWTAENLEANFEKQAKAFINNPSFNNISPKKIVVSKIFEWYAEDFGDLVGYLNRYSDTKINENAKVEFMDYNWGLNE